MRNEQHSIVINSVKPLEPKKFDTMEYAAIRHE
jgi:hypothetical protein